MTLACPSDLPDCHILAAALLSSGRSEAVPRRRSLPFATWMAMSEPVLEPERGSARSRYIPAAILSVPCRWSGAIKLLLKPHIITS